MLKLLSSRIILLIFLLFLQVFLKGQNLRISDKENFIELRKNYEDIPENDKSALPFVKAYIKKAKKEKNFEKIYQGYQDAAFYSDNKAVKLRYADSCVVSMLQSKNNDLISSSSLEKGVIYYFFYKQYQPALNEYLKAYEYSKNIDNDFLRYRIIYHLGIVKSYLGYYDDALKLFKKCSAYFEPLTRANIHPNLIYNNKKGYLNSLHQQIICFEQLRNYSKSDSLIKIGLSSLKSSDGYDLEKAYFLKCLGISDFRKKEYQKTIHNINLAIPELKKINDFTWTSVSYYYLGKSFEKINKEDLAIPYFIKVDSIFQKEKFIIPELRANYESLINYYSKVKNSDKELYYTRQLLNGDNIINKDYQYLSNKIHKEYDTNSLLERQRNLESENYIGVIILIIAFFLIVLLIIIVIHRKRKEKEILSKYLELEKRIILQEELPEKTVVVSYAIKENKVGITEVVINDILKKLNSFEQKNRFLKKGLTQQELAKSFSTNTTYLSFVINEFKGKNFNTYLNELRIQYITQKLYHNPEFLLYTIEGLAEKCGITSRQNFSDFFIDMNGIRPTDFIKQRKKELEEQEKAMTSIYPSESQA